MNKSLATTTLSNLSLVELQAFCSELKAPKFRADQIFKWFYESYTDSYDQMLNLPKALRELFAKNLPLMSSRINIVQTSKDGTKKYAFSLSDQNIVEAVLIPMGKHNTLCLSTQIGCPIRCKFCASGAKGLVRNLTAGEIIEQVWHIFKEEGFSESTNIVFMGIGEPLLNYDNLVKAIGLLHDAFNIGWRRITVSTTGVTAAIDKLSQDLPQINLAVSLHAANDHLRNQIIKHSPSSLEQLNNCLRDYYNTTHRNITYEYVMLDQVNDSLKDADALADIMHSIPSKVNLIPYNEVPNGLYKSTSVSGINNFEERLIERGVTVMVRRRKGDDIAGACGQLRQQQER